VNTVFAAVLLASTAGLAIGPRARRVRVWTVVVLLLDAGALAACVFADSGWASVILLVAAAGNVGLWIGVAILGLPNGDRGAANLESERDEG
jgi:hypothetical protein